MTGRPAAFLDRDGVLNAAVVCDGRPYPPAGQDELELLPGVQEACATLHQAGLALLVVTNQPDVGRGVTALETVEAINRRLGDLLPIDAFFVCPHDGADGCGCRKPRPGLVLQAARAWGVDLAASALVGDRWKDVAAGHAAGVATVFVDHGYDEPRPDHADLVVRCLGDAVPFILDRARHGKTT